ncbi:MULTISPECIES: SGNH/GDSL hydrolase family protein [unclassified Oceanispirochaeta]|uniref:SGNH/GDSL hydrolase family protein n=1 Tax=unclassified Oceanispirochaeta TaxID=2635722 RepID=UPI000E096D0C|nr:MULTISPECIES: SGNH/GDSL hydrolase family protein [unclassified Oceanispirochaeta]MBF9015963.1 SGNH/GDSL hydrolase family protein [Oceanispirochaeta sp. M2]NPD72426.1 SGNH/GDSL hydrolase family protein [Oceanispirochaeta sp. M1]RDG32194.1 hydrolase [Oceanispirochaeta sp. M1]
MKNVLCFGDSNTWGYMPGSGGRFDRDIRWTGKLQGLLGPDFYVIEEGLNGRTTVWDDPVEEHKNGKTQLYSCLESHKPLDLVILMLGTNDLKTRYSSPSFDIMLSIALLVSIIQKSGTGRDGQPPEILLLAPPRVEDLSDFEDMFQGAQKKSESFSADYESVAAQAGCFFLDTKPLVTASPEDGIHLDKTGHSVLASALEQKIHEIVK